MQSESQDIENPKPVLRKARIICNILFTEYEVIRKVVLETLAWRITENEMEDWDIAWNDTYIPIDKLAKMKPYQKINHFPGMHGICKKNFLAWNLNKMLKLFPNEFNYFPRTWVLPGDYSDFKSQLNKKKFFIVKPEASSQGRGIFLIRKLEDINISERYVVQEYLTEPLLIEGLKFDLRIYVLVLSCNPLKVFIHEDGLTRLATEQYSPPSPGNLADMCVHLTNYAINKNNPKFEFNRDPELDNIGHKRSLKSTFEYLLKQGRDVELLKSRIEDIIMKTLCSIQPSLCHIYKSCQPEDVTNGLCFEILGFDVIIDKNLNPILLEVNHSPSFSTDSPLDYKIKHRIIRETLIILNSRVRDRKQYHQSKKLDPGKKLVKAKDVKESREEKLERAREVIERREKWEESHMGGFKKLYPAENRERYDNFINAASNLWSDMSGHPKKKDDIVKNTSVPKAVIKPKASNSAPRRPLTLSSTSLQKLVNSVPGEGAEEGNEEETIQKMVRNYKVNHNFVDIKEFIYYKHLEEMLRDRRQAISLLRGSDAANKAKPGKVSRNKEVSQGNYIVPKTFDFSPKIAQPSARSESYKFGRTKESINVSV